MRLLQWLSHVEGACAQELQENEYDRIAAALLYGLITMLSSSPPLFFIALSPSLRLRVVIGTFRRFSAISPSLLIVVQEQWRVRVVIHLHLLKSLSE